jgi:hypothetical protein
MAKASGMGMTLSIDNESGSAQAIGNDILSCTFSTSRGVQDVTGLDKSAFERLLLLSDFNLNVTAVWNAAANPSSWGVFSTYTDNNTRTVVIVVGGKTLTAECVLTDIGWNRAQDGSFTVSATLLLANGTAAAWS